MSSDLSLELTADELARVIVALRIADILASRDLYSPPGSYVTEELDEGEREETGRLVGMLNPWGDGAVEPFRAAEALDPNLLEHDHLYAELVRHLWRSIQP